jgi:tRNA(Ile)-lysidine synthase
MGPKRDTCLAESVLERVERVLSPWRAGRILVAVSGGSDSVGLLRAVVLLRDRLRLEVVVAHLDHGVRGNAAREDSDFVRALADALAVPCHTGRWVPQSLSGFEASARRERYRWLADVAQQTGAAAVLVGHTRDDQAETIVHRFLRGTGPRGLCGMASHRVLATGVTLLRPLLRVGRDEVRGFLNELGQSWREDSSNLDVSRTRARIRHVLLPELAGSYNPRVVEAIVRLGRLAGAERQAVARYASRLTRKCILDQQGTVQIDLDARRLRALPLTERVFVLQAVWEGLGWPEQAMSARHWNRLARFPESEVGARAFPGGIEVRRCGDRLVIRRGLAGVEAPVIEPVRLPVPGVAHYPSGRLEAVIDPPHALDCNELIDADRLHGSGPLELIARPPRAGDRFEPLGLEGHSQPLADFLRSRRVTRRDRCATPVVCDAAGILWVVGHRIAHRVRCTEQTTRRIGLRWLPSNTRDATDSLE